MNSYARERGEPALAFVARIRAAWERYVGPAPSYYRYTRGRRVRAPVAISQDLANSLDVLAEIGVIPGRTPPPPPLPPVPPPPPLPVRRMLRRAPYIIDTAADGNVQYFERNVQYYQAKGPEIATRIRFADHLLPPTVEEYEPIAQALDPNAEYALYIRTFSDQGNEKNLDLLQRPFAEGKDEIITSGPRVWDGVPGEDRWHYHRLSEGNKAGSRMLGKDITAGRLKGFGDYWRKQARPYQAGVMISLVPLGAPGKEWLSMRESEKENCMVLAVRQELERSGSLTDARKKILDDEAKRLGGQGAQNEQVSELASKLRMRIQVRDLAGQLLFERTDSEGNPMYAKHMKVVTLYRSNGHCTSEEPSFAKPARVVLYATGKEEKEAKAAAVEVIKKNKITRAQMIGLEVLAEDGTLYRPISQDKGMHCFLAEKGKRPPLLDFYTDFADYSLALGEDGKEYKVPDILELGGVGGLRLRYWLEENGLKSLWAGEARECWRASMLEAVAWMAEEGVEGCTHYDMRAAYLACDRTRGAGPAFEQSKKYGFPAGGRQRVAKVHSLEDVRSLAGIVEFSRFELKDGAPSSIGAQLSKHFERSGWMPIPCALWLLDHGLIAEYALSSVMYSVRRVSHITFPEDRNEAVRLVGSCAYRDKIRAFFTRDKAECDHFARLHHGHAEKVADGYLVTHKVEDGSKTKDHSFTRAYVLNYLAIAMWDAAIKLGSKLKRCSVDAVWATKGTDLNDLGIEFTDETPKWGQFREKPAPEALTSATLGYATVNFSAAAKEERLSPLPPLPLLRWATAFIAPAGFGKTHSALRLLPEGSPDRVLVLAHNNAGVAGLRKIETNPRGYPVKTYHEFLHLDADGKKEWAPATMGGAGLTCNYIVWDEFPVAGARLLRDVLLWFRKMGIVVVLCGDPLGQLQEFEDQESGEKVMGLLRELDIHIEEGGGVDWRARNCPRLQAAKKEAWCQPVGRQVEALLSIATIVSPSAMLQMWEPQDLVFEPTTRGCSRLGRTLEEIRAKRYAHLPVRLRFKPQTKEERKQYKKKGGILPEVETPDGRLIPAVIGETIEVPAGTELPRGSPWVPDTTSTIHSAQGATVRAPRKIFICLDNMTGDWCRNAVYVAMSRAEEASQLVVFSSQFVVPSIKH